MIDNLAYRTAQSSVRAFKGEGDELMLRRYEAMDCRNCESFLQLGIDAFRWIAKADEQIRSCVYAGKVEYDEEVDSAIDTLYQLWLKPCDFAEKWIAVQQARDFSLDNLAEFRKCQAEVKAIIRDNNDISGNLAAIQEKAISEHREGNSLEWEAN